MAYTLWTDLDQVGHYARTRYRHWDQRWLDRRELLAEAQGAGLGLVRIASVLPGLHAHYVGLFSVGEAA